MILNLGKIINVVDYSSVNEASQNLTDGDTLYFPGGVWEIDTPITISNINNLVLAGSGESILKLTGTGSFKMHHLKRLTIKDINLDMNFINNAFTGFEIYNIEQKLLMENVSVTNFGNINAIGFKIYNTGIGSAGVNNRYFGTHINNFYGGNEVSYSGTTFDYQSNNAIGIPLWFGDKTDYSILNAINIFNCSTIYLEGFANGIICNSNFRFMDGRSAKTTPFTEWGAVYKPHNSYNGGKILISNCNFNHNWWYSINSDYNNTIRPFKISNCHFIANSYTAIRLSDTDTSTISDCLFNRAYNYNPAVNHPDTTTNVGILLNNIVRTKIRDCHFDDIGTCVKSQGSSDFTEIRNATTNNITQLYSLTGSNNLIV